MSKSKKQTLQAGASKYDPVIVAPIPCSAEEEKLHLRAFIERFVVQEAQARWVCLLIEKRPSGFLYPLLNRFTLNRQEQYCTPLSGTQIWPLSLRETFGDTRGVYFGLNSEPCKMTAAEAATEAFEEDAILSFVAGQSALLFTHAGIVWKCERH